MSRYPACIALLLFLTGCQSLSDSGHSAADHVKAARLTPQQAKQVAADAAPGTFGPASAPLSKACRSAADRWDLDTVSLETVKQGSDGGNAMCQHVLGTFYESGTGVPQNWDMARRLYLQAANNDTHAYLELGRMKRYGLGEPADQAKALEYFQLAGPAETLSVGGMMNLDSGAPDGQGALKLYIESTQQYGDAAWQAMRGLLRQGLKVDAAHRQKYNRLWVQGLVQKQTSYLRTPSISHHLNENGQSMAVILEYAFTAGRPTPTVSLSKSSGDPVLDGWVVSAARGIIMEPYMLSEGEEMPPILAPIVLSPSWVAPGSPSRVPPPAPSPDEGAKS